jgi:hypothetical protein
MKQKGKSSSIYLVLICALVVFPITACSFFESIFGPPGPVVGTIDPAFEQTMKEMDATSDALGSLVQFEVKKVIVSGDQITLSISMLSKASQAEFELDKVLLPESKPIPLTDQNGSVGTRVPVLQAQQVITVSFQKFAEPPPWHVWLYIGNVNGTGNKFGYPLTIKP